MSRFRANTMGTRVSPVMAGQGAWLLHRRALHLPALSVVALTREVGEGGTGACAVSQNQNSNAVVVAFTT